MRILLHSSLKRVAEELTNTGCRVFATGRSIESAELPAAGRRIPCDHTDDAQVAETFAHILAEAGRLDVLVNSVWDGYERMVEANEFTWPNPFWLQPVWRWEAMMAAGVRAGFVASQLADHGVAVVSIYPGLVRTETVLAAGVFDRSNSESPEFLGRAVAALANDTKAMRHSGKVLVAAQLGKDYGFKDIDGKSPIPITLADA